MPIFVTLQAMALFPLFGQSSNPWRSGDFDPPWEPGRPALFSDLSARLAAGEDLEEAELPDQEVYGAGYQFHPVAGLMDNIVGTKDGAGEAIVIQVRAVLRRPTPEAINQLYGHLLTDGVIGLVDEAIDLLLAVPPDWSKFATFFHWLATESPDREPTKFAIAMLGLLREDTYKTLFLTFGAHGEFTKFAAVALSNTLEPDESFEALWTLARSLRGWGRIDIVSRLSRDPTPEFQHWLVREGFKNAIMDEYLAHEAADDGDLLGQLSAADAATDDALLDGAAGIFSALVAGGPVEDISGYEDAPTALFRWFDHVGKLPGTLLRATAAADLKRFAEDSETWSDEVRSETKSRADAYLARDEIHSLAQEALRSGDGSDFWLARTLYPALGLDRWPVLFDLQVADLGARHWYDLMEAKDEDRIDQVIALAETALPLEDMASGPGEEIGLGAEWQNVDSLTFVVQGLANHPGKGWPLIKTALNSPVIRCRNTAARALKAWPKSAWPPGALGTVRKAILEEPRQQVKDFLEELLRPE